MPTSKVTPSRTPANAAKSSKTKKWPAKKSSSKKAAAKRAAAKSVKPPAAPKVARAAPPKARPPASLPKSDGDDGVHAYIASMEPWQAAIAQRVDDLVVELVPGVRKAIRWRNPIYGVEGKGWFLAFAAFQRHIKFSFFKGALLDPAPPLGTFHDVRSLDVRETDEFDAKRFTTWIEQATAIPGWDGGSPRKGGEPL